MTNIETNFFESKRPWSKLNDEVIQKYLPPYLKKVNKLNERIILVDSFAGPGIFEDKSKGSPLYICELAEKFVPENYFAILVNKNQSHHQKLETVLSGYIENKKAIAIKGKAEDLLKRISNIITTETIFIYLDPFGLRGTDYHLLKYFLDRSKRYSTELIINVSIPTILRLSSINSYNEKGLTDAIESKHKSLSKVLGGDYWREYLLDKSIPKEIRINLVLEDYKNRLTSFLPEVGLCPVYEKNEISTMKYCIFFASRHQDAKLLMNNIMFNSYSSYIWSRNYEIHCLEI